MIAKRDGSSVSKSQPPTKRGSATKKKAAPNDASAVSAYLSALSPESRAGLSKLRKTIAAIAPTATQGISYGIPAFKLNGRPLVWFAAFKNHSSFFPGVTAIRVHAARLKAYKISKGTIQFPPGSPPPATLIAKLIKTRFTEIQKPRR
jgi:uncharacterized protein YdhG (YjbR/CyaY superfamily)